MTRTNSSTFSDADILALMKVRQVEIAKAILDADEDILLVPQYADLEANQREYTLPTDMLSSLKRIEAKLDGTNYVKLDEIDITTVPYTINSESSITQYFSNEEGMAKFSLSRKAIKIWSGTITDVTDGLKILVNTLPSAITDLSLTTDMSIDPSTTTLGIPIEMHEIWARGVIIDWKSSREKPIPLSQQEQVYGIDLIKAINSLKPQNANRSFVASLPPASERGNEGADY
jgi:hypothetical protein